MDLMKADIASYARWQGRRGMLGQDLGASTAARSPNGAKYCRAAFDGTLLTVFLLSGQSGVESTKTQAVAMIGIRRATAA